MVGAHRSRQVERCHAALRAPRADVRHPTYTHGFATPIVCVCVCVCGDGAGAGDGDGDGDGDSDGDGYRDGGSVVVVWALSEPMSVTPHTPMTLPLPLCVCVCVCVCVWAGC